MKKLLSFGWLVLVGAVFGVLWLKLTELLASIFHLPEAFYWLWVVAYLAIGTLLMARIDPRKLDVFTTFPFNLNAKDKFIFFFSCAIYFASFLLLLEIKDNLSNTAVWLFMGVGVASFFLPSLLFGSKELREKIFGKKNEHDNL